ncbi:nucleotide exchange factor GrpE [Pseudoclavibacter chungangensis]|uniref:Protein GrpE n=1 Tax=Pseudoclavibacter chungangensis TaxID=587635 RepID=A0A7J5C1D4_9MICO|nr:nucleotide exchange factor GrpE [Pseudoclavibacter chungangensis]KAB1662446.1 nucleotide exchange factor GrpE [Pseudoclavibacter chungangensis]NYJ68477.1 molecular chaperone GrpE [Pseudoclavibacter chungangensis]
MTTENPNDHEEPIFRDKRRIDPVTGKVRSEAGADGSAPAAPGAGDSGQSLSDEDLSKLLSGEGADEAPAEQEAQAADRLAAERLADLQRVTAEYANYRRRTEQERLEAKDRTTADVLRAILPVLDDLDRAEKHGDLPTEGPIAVIAAKLRGVLDKQGLEAYGEKGDTFDPKIHEAIAQLPSPDADGETVADVVERGYRVGDRIVRVAKVAVTVPAS